jgi:uncharacterized protein (TIGR02246 family)
MLRPVHVLSAVVGTLVLSACTSAPPDTAADVKAIAGVRDAYVAAFSAEDADKTAALYTTDGIRMDDNRPLVSGRDAIRARYTEMMSGFDSDVQLKSEETVVNGDWAFDRGQTWLHLMPKDPKSTVPMVMDQGKYLVVLKKQPDNSWLISRVMSNSNIGLPPTAAATK